MDDHPAYFRLHAAILRLAATTMSFHGILYRACAPNYPNQRDLLTGEGARKIGGRWNPPGRIATVYLATSLEGALAETLGLASHYGFDPSSRLPMTLVAIDATLDRVLDLSDAGTRRSLHLTLSHLTDCPWRVQNAVGREALTQALGRAAHTARIQGILVNSSVKRTLRNLNVFPSNSPPSALSIRSADKLPPPPAPGTI